MTRKRTATSNFGVAKREGHDASGFYRRFAAPKLDLSDDIAPAKPVDDPFQCADARTMTAVEDNSVALVVTSPPYFAGKAYEEDLEADGVPGSYLEYLQMLRDVFAECVRVLEPGGRIAVNVANLGRRPFRSLSSDVTSILQDDLGLLLRGEIIWRKGESASGSCAWGSYRSPSNPVLRDVSERIIVAGKGRFDRAIKRPQREAAGLPSEPSIGPDDFIESTLDVWTMAPESASRVGHPAPFPVALPARLIDLYTYVDDLVLDPFMGAGTTLLAAAQSDRRFIGYDTDPDYVAIARQRVGDSMAEGRQRAESPMAAPKLATQWLLDNGFSITAEDRAVRGSGLRVNMIATDSDGAEWAVLVGGGNSTWTPGLSSNTTALRTMGELFALRSKLDPDVNLMLITTALPPAKSPAGIALDSAVPDTVQRIVNLGQVSDTVTG